MEPVEHICSEGVTLAYLIRRDFAPDETAFVTSPQLGQQVGFVVRRGGSDIPRHFHRPRERRVTGTPEVLVVRDGRCEVDVYDEARALVATRELGSGDVLVLVSGGHGFRMLQDTTLLEVKQGPYLDPAEKEHF